MITPSEADSSSSSESGESVHDLNDAKTQAILNNPLNKKRRETTIGFLSSGFKFSLNLDMEDSADNMNETIKEETSSTNTKQTKPEPTLQQLIAQTKRMTLVPAKLTLTIPEPIKEKSPKKKKPQVHTSGRLSAAS